MANERFTPEEAVAFIARRSNKPTLFTIMDGLQSKPRRDVTLFTQDASLAANPDSLIAEDTAFEDAPQPRPLYTSQEPPKTYLD